MSKAKARVFVPLTKVDEEQRLVYGTITAQEVDQAGETMDYETSKPNFEKWSGDIETATGGLSKGNLRVMHGLNVAGKLTDLTFNDNDKAIEVCAKIVDDAEWNKVLEGCYTGFSVGGRYGKKWNETIDGAVVKKFTAVPNEVSIVDNPCVKSATFQLIKADGAEEEVLFKAADGITASGEIDGAENAPGTGTKPKGVTKLDSDPKIKKPAPKPTPGSVEKTVSNEEVAAKATELAKAAGDDKVWTDFIDAAREELLKAEDQRDPGDEAPDDEEGKEAEAEPAAEDADEAEANDDSTQKVTPPGVKQKWATSDNQVFEKKADAVAHEATLTPVVELSEADKLAARLEKALDPKQEEDPELPLLEDFDRLSKAVSAIITPFGEDGKPKLEKGMFMVNRFSNVLADMASLAKCIKNEGKREGDDQSDAAVSTELLDAVKTLGKSFITYATNQVTELLAGMDDDVVVSYHDYYYDAVQNDPENGLAKDVCALINELREPAKETRETLAKAFGLILGEELETDDELSPPMRKRFDALEEDNEKLKKVAEDAVASVEQLAKRLTVVEETPMPRAPTGEVLPKDGTFLGKAAGTEEEKMAILQDMLKTHGADGMATLMIKASQASGGHQLTLKS